MPAPLGYLDNGAAKPKTLDPKTVPLVRQAFELYAPRHFSLRTLGPELHRLRLRRPDGKPYLRNRLSKLLNSPFYSGVIRIKKARRALRRSTRASGLAGGVRAGTGCDGWKNQSPQLRSTTSFIAAALLAIVANTP